MFKFYKAKNRKFCNGVNIAFITFDLPGEAQGGVSYAVHYLANELVARGINVTIFTTSPKPENAKYQVCQIKMPFFIRRVGWLKAAVFPIFISLKNFNDFNVIHAHGDDQYIFTKTPIIRTFYGSALDEAIHATSILRFLYQLFYVYPAELISGLKAKAKAVISKSIRKRYPFYTEVIYCGIDLDVFKPAEKNTTPVILYVGGRLKGRKRGQLLVKIFKNTIQKEIPDAELWLVCKEKIKQTKGIKLFLGNLKIEQLAQLYQKAWIFCLPSKYEGLGLPYIEALASGCAVVSTINSGAKEILDNSKYGCMVDDDKLAGLLLELIKDDKKRKSYEIKGLERAKDFSQNVTLREYLNIYKNLLGRHYGKS